MVCTECPWRLRHEYPERAGLICSYHIRRFDGMPAPEVIARFLKKRGFRDDTLERLPICAVVGALQRIRATMR